MYCAYDMHELQDESNLMRTESHWSNSEFNLKWGITIAIMW